MVEQLEDWDLLLNAGKDGVVGNGAVSSYERLRVLPSVFSLAEASTILDVDYNYLRLMLSRFKTLGLVQPLGKTGVYFNYIKNPENMSDLIPEAVSKAVKRPIVQVGGAMLRKAGFTQQRNTILEFAVAVTGMNKSLPTTIPGVELLRRPEWWLNALSSQRSQVLVRHCSAEMAMADIILSSVIDAGEFDITPKPTLPWQPDKFDLDDFSVESKEEIMRCIGQIMGSVPSTSRRHKFVFEGETPQTIFDIFIEGEMDKIDRSQNNDFMPNDFC